MTGLKLSPGAIDSTGNFASNADLSLQVLSGGNFHHAPVHTYLYSINTGNGVQPLTYHFRSIRGKLVDYVIERSALGHALIVMSARALVKSPGALRMVHP